MIHKGAVNRNLSEYGCAMHRLHELSALYVAMVI